MYFFSRPLGSLLGMGVALVLFVVLSAWLYEIASQDLRRRFGASDADASRDAKRGSTGGPSAKQRGTQPEATIPVDRDSTWVKTLQMTGQETRTTLAELDQALVTWNNHVTELLHNESGRRIAASKERCEAFAAVTEKERPSHQEAALLRARLDELTKRLDEALAAQQRPLAWEMLPNQAKQLAHDARTAWRSYHNDLAVLDALVASPKDTLPARATLAEALNDLKLAEANARAQRLIVARKTTQEQADQAEANARLEKEKREQAFGHAYAEMKNYVLPFTAEALPQLEGNGFKPSSVKGPVSWMALQRYLKQDERVSVRLCQVVAGAKDRPLGMFPPLPPNRARIDLVTIKKVQQFLTDYGELMVEKKLLAP